MKVDLTKVMNAIHDLQYETTELQVTPSDVEQEFNAEDLPRGSAGFLPVIVHPMKPIPSKLAVENGTYETILNIALYLKDGSRKAVGIKPQTGQIFEDVVAFAFAGDHSSKSIVCDSEVWNVDDSFQWNYGKEFQLSYTGHFFVCTGSNSIYWSWVPSVNKQKYPFFKQLIDRLKKSMHKGGKKLC